MATWITFAADDESTWPPERTLVLTKVNDHIGLHTYERDEEFPHWRDEGNDYDDGIEDDDRIVWVAIPEDLTVDTSWEIPD